MDVKKTNSGYRLFVNNATKATDLAPVAFAKRMQELGAGEIVINSIDNDGVMKGYDLELARLVRASTRLPMSVVGGAGSLAHLGELIRVCGVVGAVAGSLFVFKGPYRAVLINYPAPAQKDDLFRASLPA